MGAMGCRELHPEKQGDRSKAAVGVNPALNISTAGCSKGLAGCEAGLSQNSSPAPLISVLVMVASSGTEVLEVFSCTASMLEKCGFGALWCAQCLPVCSHGAVRGWMYCFCPGLQPRTSLLRFLHPFISIKPSSQRCWEERAGVTAHNS